MRIAVIGAGGVGSTFGAALARSGAEVTFVARGAHLTAVRQNGLRIEGDRAEIHLQPTRATDDPSTIGPVDVVLFCVKLWDVESAGTNIRPLIGPETAVIPLQNGIDASQRLISILGVDAVMGGVAIVTAAIASPGVIRQTGSHQRIVFGESGWKKQRSCGTLRATMSKGRIRCCSERKYPSVNLAKIRLSYHRQFLHRSDTPPHWEVAR